MDRQSPNLNITLMQPKPNPFPTQTLPASHRGGSGDERSQQFTVPSSCLETGIHAMILFDSTYPVT